MTGALRRGGVGGVCWRLAEGCLYFEEAGDEALGASEGCGRLQVLVEGDVELTGLIYLPQEWLSHSAPTSPSP